MKLLPITDSLSNLRDLGIGQEMMNMPMLYEVHNIRGYDISGAPWSGLLGGAKLSPSVSESFTGQKQTSLLPYLGENWPVDGWTQFSVNV